MLSWPDFKEKQIVYIDASEMKNISIKNGNMAVKQDGKILNQISLSKIFAVFVEGSVTLTTVFIKKVMREGGMIVLLSRSLSPLCVIGGETEGNFLLRERQYEGKNNLLMAKWIVENKIGNQLSLLKKVRKKSVLQKNSIKEIKLLLKKIEFLDNEKSLLGIEGNASKHFFRAYFEDVGWYGRKPRTKCDGVNVLMDMGYTFLFNFIECNLRLYGFDIYKGFYHTGFYQRKSLVCDIEEAFRGIVEYCLWRAISLKIFDKSDFKVKNGQYEIKKGRKGKYVKLFLSSIMDRKEDVFKFVQKYYRAVMRGADDYPIFNIFD